MFVLQKRKKVRRKKSRQKFRLEKYCFQFNTIPKMFVFKAKKYANRISYCPVVYIVHCTVCNPYILYSQNCIGIFLQVMWDKDDVFVRSRVRFNYFWVTQLLCMQPPTPPPPASFYHLSINLKFNCYLFEAYFLLKICGESPESANSAASPVRWSDI